MYICTSKPQKPELESDITGEGSCAEPHSQIAEKELVSQELYGASLVDTLARSSKKKMVSGHAGWQ